MDFNQALRQQQARDQEAARAAASHQGSQHRHAEHAAAEVQKALRDLAHYCEQNNVPKFQFKPPTMKGFGVRHRDRTQ